MIETARIVTSEDESSIEITCSGALDLTNSDDLRENLARASESVDSVTVDMVRTVFVDTAILSYLAHGAKVMLGRGKRLNVLVKDKSQPLRVLRTVGFLGLMNVEVADSSD